MKYQTQKSNTYSKLTIEALEQGVKYVQSKKKTVERWRRSALGGWWFVTLLANIFLIKINNRDSTITCEICKDMK